MELLEFKNLLKDACDDTIELVSKMSGFLTTDLRDYSTDYNEDAYTSLLIGKIQQKLDNQFPGSVAVGQLQAYHQADEKKAALDSGNMKGLPDITVFINDQGRKYELIIEAKRWRDIDEDSWKLSDAEVDLLSDFKKYSVYEQLLGYCRTLDPYRARQIKERYGCILIYQTINDNIDIDAYFDKAIQTDQLVFCSNRYKDMIFYGILFKPS